MSKLHKTAFGTTARGEAVDLWTLEAGEYSAEILSRGGVLRSFRVPAAEGTRDIVLGSPTLEALEAQDKYFGAIVGRVANRIGGASFDLHGKQYSLAANNGPNCLHGGNVGFDQVIWDAIERNGALVLSYVSPDGEEGFPGTLAVQVTYSLSDDGALSIAYEATSDADTLCNLTCHAYFNLLGHDAGSLAGQRIQILSDAITAIDESSVPTGEMMPVEGTPFDLREAVLFTDGLAQGHPQLTLGTGYDHNFILSHVPYVPERVVARVMGGGLELTCSTTQPGVQLYTSNFLSGDAGKHGASYGPRSAFCLETQAWPDAVHHAHFPSVVLKKGETYRQQTTYQVRLEE